MLLNSGIKTFLQKKTVFILYYASLFTLCMILFIYLFIIIAPSYLLSLSCVNLILLLTESSPIFCPNRNRHKPYSQQRLNAFSTEHLTKYGNLFPSGGNQCQELNQSYSEADSYIDVINHNVNKKICPHGNTVEEFGKAHQKCIKTQFGDHNSEYNQKHEKLCIKYNQRPLQKR